MGIGAGAKPKQWTLCLLAAVPRPRALACVLTFVGIASFHVMKLKFGFVKVRYRGLKKNAHRLFVTCALVNLFVSRRKLLAVA